ncbi:MAG: iron donor protein CyaY [Chrysiogenetes bacterium]|nr:iron donor protein CyaY [Chrysiogenetes bacterium]
MEEKEFRSVADDTLFKLLERLDEIELDDADVELADGVLTVEFEDGKKLIVSRQSAASQLWLAEPGGGWHFDHSDGIWICDKRGTDLIEDLARLITEKTGVHVKLRHDS